MARQRGIQENNGTKRTFITVSKGDFVKRVKEETAKSTPRILEKGTNKGETVHEERFNEFVGRLVEVKIEDHNQYGKSWEFKIDVTPSPEAQPEYFVLKLPYASGYAIDVLRRLPNADTSDDILFKGYRFTPEGETKERIGITLLQWDANDKGFTLKNAFEKGSLPDWEKVDAPDGNGKVWSKVKFMKALEAEIFEKVVSNLEGVPEEPIEEEATIEEELPTPETGDDADVPW